MALIPVIWFNPDVPENLSIYLVNKKTGEVLVHCDNKWVISNESEINNKLRSMSYEITEKLLRLPVFSGFFDPFISKNISKNKNDSELSKIELETIHNIHLENRDLVKPHVK